LRALCIPVQSSFELSAKSERNHRPESRVQILARTSVDCAPRHMLNSSASAQADQHFDGCLVLSASQTQANRRRASRRHNVDQVVPRGGSEILLQYIDFTHFSKLVKQVIPSVIPSRAKAYPSTVRSLLKLVMTRTWVRPIIQPLSRFVAVTSTWGPRRSP